MIRSRFPTPSFNLRNTPTFMRFVAVSGAGWLLDASLLLALIGAFHAPAFGASLVSSSIAATCVFLVSRRFIFDGKATFVGLRVGFYMCYTIGVIVIAAAAIQAIVTMLRGTAESDHIVVGSTVLAGIAKIVVTPPQLLANFLVARSTSERSIPVRK
jgi:putative flippase GtrA